MNKTTEALAIEALEMIAGERVCINNLLSDKDIAREALAAIRSALADHIADADKMVAEPVKQEPVACKHEWFRTGAMQVGECRCIHCGEWKSSAPVDAKAIRAEALEEAAKVCEEGTALIQFQSTDCYSYAYNRAAAIRGLK